MKTTVENQVTENAAGKQVKINEGTRKYTLSIYEHLIDVVKASWEMDIEVEKGQQAIADVLYDYSKKEGKEAVKMILADDMDVFSDKKKPFRIYAQKVLVGGRELSKDRIDQNNEAVQQVIDKHERIQAAIASPEIAHPMGEGMHRIKNEIRLRPMFMMEDMKFKFLRAIGVY